ncbi:hypothetical protein IHE45_06G046900 [Dioscorea alata]|uniref:Uncharacterized protein n=1 Tax=Dioscorea alata TaxID=55571 RepID=A0ACB7VWQ4_DIOAL|nr:hypothetical protein IHE45_06G046900 [Dioscorea alata]
MCIIKVMVHHLYFLPEIKIFLHQFFSFLALTSMTTTTTTSTSISTSCKDEFHGIFNMASLKIHLPQKRKGLSSYYSGKSKSFACLSEAKSTADLEKKLDNYIPEAKRRKYLNQHSVS